MSEDKNSNKLSDTPAGCDDAEDKFINQESVEHIDDFTYA